MLKKILNIIMIITLSFTFVACGSQNKENVKAKWVKLSITVSENSTWYEGAIKFKEIVEERTQGRYEVEIFSDEQLSGGNQVKGIENIQNGVSDIDIHSTIIYTIVDPRFTVLNMPWMIPTYEEADAALAGKGGELIFEIAKENGIVPLAFGESGYRQMTNNVRPIAKPSDFENLKIRVPGIEMFLDLFGLLGADPTAMNFSEVFTSLQQETIDGQENPVDIICSAKLEEVQKYLTMSNYVYDALLMSASTKLWDTLSDDDKVIFQEAAKEAMDLQKEIARQVNNEKIEYLEKEMQVNVLTPGEITTFQKAVAPLYVQWEEILGLELMEAFGYIK